MIKNVPILSHLIHVLFPELCHVCGSGLVKGEHIMCVPCFFNLPRTNAHTDPDNKTSELFAGRVPFTAATSYFYYSKYSKYAHLIHMMKYKGKPDIGVYLGKLLGQELKNTGFSAGIDLIIPVPLHKKRMRKRGYNQSLCIAEGISLATGIAIDTKSVIRVVNTSTQTKKDREQRAENMADVFTLDKEHGLASKHVLLVDDVITTGATIESLARCIEQVENIRVSIASLGIASLQ